MREIAFIKINKEKWLEFEQAIFGKAKKNPDEMANLYIQLMNDLSYAQTYYPKSKTVVYLNHLASQIYQKIYKTKRTESNRLVYFFKTEVPLLLYDYRRYLVYAFVLFFATVFIGVVSARYDADFVRLILGDSYVNETLENIKAGNPVAIYKSGSNWGSFIGITFNNLKSRNDVLHFRNFWRYWHFFYFIAKCHYAGFIPIFFLATRCFLEKCSWHLDSRFDGNFRHRDRNCSRLYFGRFHPISQNLFENEFL